MSNFKLAPDFPKARSDPLPRRRTATPGDSLIIKGRPSFTRLRRISIGLINAARGRGLDRPQAFRAASCGSTSCAPPTSPRTSGIADRVLVGGHVANLPVYNVAWNSRDADFLSVGETRGSGSRTTNLAVTSRSTRTASSRAPASSCR